MIDYEALQKLYDKDLVYALQLEIGDVCHQGCIYCYMNAIEQHRNKLSDKTVFQILSEAKKFGIMAIEWLGGEPLLRGNIFEFMKTSKELGYRNNMWTGGLPLVDENVRKHTADLCRKGLISFHLSTIDKKLYKEMHPNRPVSDVDDIIDAIVKLIEVDKYPPEQILNSVTFTGMQSLEDMKHTMDHFFENYGIRTSLNVYHTYLRPGYSKSDLERFIPSRGDVARLYKHYARQWDANELPMNCVNKQYCSATIAILYDGKVTPCATIRPENAPNINGSKSLSQIFNENKEEMIFNKFKDDKNLPDKCRICSLYDSCWGCRSRSYASGNGIYGLDPQCYRR